MVMFVQSILRGPQSPWSSLIVTQSCRVGVKASFFGKPGLRTVTCWSVGCWFCSSVSLPQHSLVPKNLAVGLVAWGVSPLGQENLGVGSASQELFRVCFQDCFRQKGNRRGSNQMTFIKILSLSPSPFENSLE